MKGRFFLISLLLLLPVLVFAQTEEATSTEPLLDFLITDTSTSSKYIQCHWYNPVNALGNPPTIGQSWQFNDATCTLPFISYYEDSTSSTRFYLSETITYGDIFLGLIFLLLLVFGILKLIWTFIFPKMFKALTTNDL